MNIYFPQHCAARWVRISFTRIGREVGSILAPPDFEENIRKVGLVIAPQGVTKVEMHSAGKPVELIYTAPFL